MNLVVFGLERNRGFWKPVQIYVTEDGQTQMDVRFEQDKIWLFHIQMAELFDKDTDTIDLLLEKYI